MIQELSKYFREDLDMFWKKQEQKFNYKVPIVSTTTHDHSMGIVKADELEPQT